MRVLIADDSAISRRLLRAALAMWDYEVVEATDGREALRVLEASDGPQLAILDWHMPGLDGPGICHKLRAMPHHPYVYVILLTVRGERESLLEGLEAGADEYLVKPFDPEVLQQRLRAGARIVELQDRLIGVQEALRVQATRDPLTGIMNRGAILDALVRELDRGRRNHTPVAIALGDVDRFKRINDTLGHVSGDAVLRQVASRMAAELRPYDSLGRYGGEEFLVVLPGSVLGDAGRVAERLREKLASTRIEVAGECLQVTMSLGVSAQEGTGLLDVEELIHRADIALYRAKTEGRNCVRCHELTEAKGCDSGNAEPSPTAAQCSHVPAMVACGS